MTVKFQHLGLTVTNKSDVREFYQDILKMNIQREFTLNKALAGRIFNQEKDINIVVGTIGDLTVELFLADEKQPTSWQHVCLAVADRPALIENCRAKKYPVTVIEREPFDIVFIRDKSENLFEIKEVG